MFTGASGKVCKMVHMMASIKQVIRKHKTAREDVRVMPIYEHDLFDC